MPRQPADENPNISTAVIQRYAGEKGGQTRLFFVSARGAMHLHCIFHLSPPLVLAPSELAMDSLGILFGLGKLR